MLLSSSIPTLFAASRSHLHLSSAPSTGAKEFRVKSIVLLAGVIGMLASFGCVVDAGIGAGGGGGAACEPVLCGDALVQGIPQGAPLCDAISDDAYADIVGCACGDSLGAGACAEECGDNLCADLGETGAC